MTDKEIHSKLALRTREWRQALRDADAFKGRLYPRWPAHQISGWTEPANPLMPSLQIGQVLNSDGLRARQYLIENWDAIDATGGDPILKKLEKMAPFVDDAWDGDSWSPSELMIIGYLIARTDLINAKRVTRAKFEAMNLIEEGRRRWKAGFSANPFGEPRIRNGASS